METALKEGISVPGDGSEPSIQPNKEGVKEAASSPDGQTEKPSAPPQEGAPRPEGVSEEDWHKTPAHFHPVVKRMAGQNREIREELRKAQELNLQFQEALQEMRTSRKTPIEEHEELSEEQKDALDKLAKLLSSHPSFKGIEEKLAALDKRHESVAEAQQKEKFGKEMNLLEQECGKYGLSYDQVEAECQEWLDNHDYFSKIPLQPGFYTMAFRDLYFDKSADLGTKAANLKLIKDREKLKAASSEKPEQGKSESSEPQVTSLNDLKDRLARRISKEGGIEL